MFVRER